MMDTRLHLTAWVVAAAPLAAQFLPALTAVDTDRSIYVPGDQASLLSNVAPLETAKLHLSLVSIASKSSLAIAEPII